jgi:hypothetical protein
VVLDFVRLGCVVSGVGCSVLEIDLVKQPFLIRFFSLDFLAWLFAGIDFGRIASFEKYSDLNYFL